MAEFNDVGFDATNSNRIARRAGFAPQTFYRHFTDKLEVFLACYDRWWRNEIDQLTGAADARRSARLILEAHRASRMFRRSLRALTVSDPKVADARAQARREQIRRISRRVPDADEADIIVAVLIVERIADAIVEGELEKLGFDQAAAEAQLTRALVW